MKCPHCSAQVMPESVFCHRCGERLSDAAAAPRQALLSQMQRGATASTEPDPGTLEPDRGLWQGSYSAKDMVSSWLVAGLLTLALPLVASIVGAPPAFWLGLAALLLLLWLGLLGQLVWRKLGVRYQLTSARLIHHRGVLTRYSQRLELIDIDDVSFRQGLVERLFGVGTIVIHSSDRSDPVLVMRGIDRVQTVAAEIDDARRAERARRGLHIESI